MYGCSDKIVCLVVQKGRQKQGIYIPTNTDTMDITESQLKSSNLELWSKIFVPFAPSSKTSSPPKRILQNALPQVILSDSCCQYLFCWTALHAIKYILSSKLKALILIDTELIRAIPFLEISSPHYIFAD